MTIMAIEPAQTNVLERVIIEGDLSVLTPQERVSYYNEVCRSLALNPFTKPFDYLKLQGRGLTLYATKNATDQLRQLRGISITKLETNEVQGVYIVTTYGRDKDGRIDSAQGAVSIKGLQGNDLANAMMKAETKSKRRLTLSMCGLGFMDETEVETVAGARTHVVDMDTGEVLEQTKRELPKPRPDIITEGTDRFWVRYLEIAGQAEDLGIPFEPLKLPIGRNLLVAEGQKLARIIAEVAPLPT